MKPSYLIIIALAILLGTVIHHFKIIQKIKDLRKKKDSEEHDESHGHGEKKKSVHPFWWTILVMIGLFILSLVLQPVWRRDVSNFSAHVLHSTGDALTMKESEKPRTWTPFDVFWDFQVSDDNGNKHKWTCWNSFLREATSTTLIFRVPTKYNDLRKAEYVRFEWQNETQSIWKNEKTGEMGKWSLISRGGNQFVGRVWIKDKSEEKSYTFTLTKTNILHKGW